MDELHDPQYHIYQGDLPPTTPYQDLTQESHLPEYFSNNLDISDHLVATKYPHHHVIFCKFRRFNLDHHHSDKSHQAHSLICEF